MTTRTGTYEVKARWLGNANTLQGESTAKTVKAEQEAALNDFTSTDYAIMPRTAHKEIEMNKIQEFPLPFGFALIAIVVLAASFKLRKKLIFQSVDLMR